MVGYIAIFVKADETIQIFIYPSPLDPVLVICYTLCIQKGHERLGFFDDHTTPLLVGLYDVQLGQGHIDMTENHIQLLLLVRGDSGPVLHELYEGRLGGGLELIAHLEEEDACPCLL